MADAPWSDEELRASIILYRQVLISEAEGERLSPTALHRTVIQGSLSARSIGSVGRRMSNLTAVFQAEGLPTAHLYKGTLSNVGSNVTRRILNIYADLIGEAAEPTADVATLKARTRKLRGKIHAAPAGNTKPPRQPTTTLTYVRDPAVCAYVLDRAKGVCEACCQPAPFAKADGEPFLEVHHVVHLAEGGADTASNAIAACPNCHRRLHHSADRADFREAVWTQWPFLERA